MYRDEPVLMDEIVSKLPHLREKSDVEIADEIVTYYKAWCAMPTRPDRERDREANEKIEDLKRQNRENTERSDEKLEELRTRNRERLGQAEDRERTIRLENSELKAKLTEDCTNTTSSKILELTEELGKARIQVHDVERTGELKIARTEGELTTIRDRCRELQEENTKYRKVQMVNENSSKKGKAGEAIWHAALGQHVGSELKSLDHTGGTAHMGDFHVRNMENKLIVIDVKEYSGTVKQGEIDKLKRDVQRHECYGGIMISKSSITGVDSKKKKVEFCQNKCGDTVPIVLMQGCVSHREDDVLTVMWEIKHLDNYHQQDDQKNIEKEFRESIDLHKRTLGMQKQEKEHCEKRLRSLHKSIPELQKFVEKHSSDIVEQNTESLIDEMYERSEDDIICLSEFMKDHNKSPTEIREIHGNKYTEKALDLEARKNYQKIKGLKTLPKPGVAINILKGYKSRK